MSSKAIFVLILSLFTTIQTALAAPIYRETFSFCGDATRSYNADSLSQWSALVAGKNEGKVGFLKVSPTGSFNRPTAIESDPTGPYEANALWTKKINSKNRGGLLIFTDEFSFAVNSLSSISFEQRNGLFSRDSNQDLVIEGAKIALRIGNLWYISDQKFAPTQKNVWQSFQATAANLTFGTSPVYPNVGPLAPQDSGKALPAGSQVIAFGLFYPSVNSRIRIDNFTISDFSQTSTAPEIDPSTLACKLPNVGGTPGASYDVNGFCLNGGGDKYVKMARRFESKMYPSSNSKQVVYLRNKAALRLAIRYKQKLSQLTALAVGDFQKSLTGTYTLKLVSGGTRTLPKSLGKTIESYIALGGIGSNPLSPLLRPSVPKNRLSTVGICGNSLRSALRDRAERLGIRGRLNFSRKPR